MAGLTLSERDTALLRDVVELCSHPGDAPVSWEALEATRELIRADDLSLTGHNRYPLHMFYGQGVADGVRETDSETPAEALSNPFWQEYWASSCSYPERTGDYASVTTNSDFGSMADNRAWCRAHGNPYEHEIMAPVQIGRGRHLRLLGWRGPGPDFDDRARFHLALLRPHFARAWLLWDSAHPSAPELTHRQLLVLALVRDGLTNLQIAHRLGLSEATVRTHLNNVHARLGVTSRTAAVQAVFGGRATAY